MEMRKAADIVLRRKPFDDIEEIKQAFNDNPNISQVFIEIPADFDLVALLKYTKNLFLEVKNLSRSMYPVIVGPMPMKRAACVDEFDKIHVSSPTKNYEDYCDMLDAAMQLQVRKDREFFLAKHQGPLPPVDFAYG